MAAFDVRDMLKADAAAASPTGFGGGSEPRTHRFHPLAERIAAIPVKPTLSPVMIEGLVRLADAVTICAVGALVFAAYAAGHVASLLPYQLTVGALAIGALGLFQMLRLYVVGSLRNYVGTAMRLLSGWTTLFMVAIAVFFFLKIGDTVSRVWLLGFYVGGGLALLGERFLANRIVLRQVGS